MSFDEKIRILLVIAYAKCRSVKIIQDVRESKTKMDLVEKNVIKTASSNLTFVESEGPADPRNIALYERNVNVKSSPAHKPRRLPTSPTWK